MNEKIANALSYIDERYIAAAAKRKKHRYIFPAAVAAVLALVLILRLPTIPLAIPAKAVSLASETRLPPRPERINYIDSDAYWDALRTWRDSQESISATAQSALSELQPFFVDGSAQFLGNQTKGNTIWSPVNAYIGLSMISELTDGESRQQILSLFGADDISTLREQVGSIWESTYCNNGKGLSVLAGSLWLDDKISYRQEAMDNLAHHYYCSIYQGELGSEKTNRAIRAWLNNNTGNLLKKSTNNISLPPDTVLAAYATIDFQSKWRNEFSSKNNTDAVFHTPDADVTVTFMNKKLAQMGYYWGDQFSAVALSLKNGSTMWFILPDEGLTPSDVLSDGQYMQLLLQQNWENSKFMKVNLSVPKFDIQSTVDLKNGLKKMGITDVFSDINANFTELTAEIPIFLTSATQSVRVKIDEEGVKAAAYIEFPGATSAAPPDEIIDFVLNRPFIFAISKANVPMFVGTINDPSQ